MKYVYFKHLCLRGLASIFTCSLYLFFFFILGILVGTGGGWVGDEGEREMRCLNTPLPSSPLSSLHPTPPHTWDGHFISECSKWKGDLNLPCFPLNPPSLSLSISHTQSLILLMDSTLPVA